jgi:hypothetical protein
MSLPEGLVNSLECFWGELSIGFSYQEELIPRFSGSDLSWLNSTMPVLTT